MRLWMRAMVACAVVGGLSGLTGCESDDEDDPVVEVIMVTNVVVSGGQTNFVISSELADVSLAPVNVPVAPLAILRADLTITDLSSTPADFFGWQVRVTVKNIGALNSTGFKVRLYRDGALKDTVSIPGLLSGAQATFTFPNYSFGCPAQPNAPNSTMRAVADSSGEISETDETNNAYQESWGCPPP